MADFLSLLPSVMTGRKETERRIGNKRNQIRGSRAQLVYRNSMGAPDMPLPLPPFPSGG
jgi:hypothetical protein